VLLDVEPYVLPELVLLGLVLAEELLGLVDAVELLVPSAELRSVWF
jgi:hypothetical protein